MVPQPQEDCFLDPLWSQRSLLTSDVWRRLVACWRCAYRGMLGSGSGPEWPGWGRSCKGRQLFFPAASSAFGDDPTLVFGLFGSWFGRTPAVLRFVRGSAQAPGASVLSVLSVLSVSLVLALWPFWACSWVPAFLSGKCAEKLFFWNRKRGQG